MCFALRRAETVLANSDFTRDTLGDADRRTARAHRDGLPHR